QGARSEIALGPSGFEPESPAPQAGRISCGWAEECSPHPNQATPRTRSAVSKGCRTKNPSPGRPRSTEREDFVDQFGVRQDHAPATVPLQAERVEHLAGLLAGAAPLDERWEGASDDLAACEASDGDDHSFTGTTSAASC